MAAILYCRHADCGKPYPSEAGKRPSLCPECGRIGRWTTQAPAATPAVLAVPKPFVWHLTPLDRKFLRAGGIQAPDQD